MPNKNLDLSFIIPAKNESESLPTLCQEILKVVSNLHQSFEILIIDDGSTDSTWPAILSLHSEDKRVHGFRLRGNWGKSTALQTGFDHAQGQFIFTLDADLQDNPIEIPSFLQKLGQGYDLVIGWKKTRHDPSYTVISSRILNYILIPLFTGVKIHDSNCGFKAYRREVVQNLNLYGELYRYIPIIAAKQNFKIAEIKISHRKRQFGRSKYGLTKNIKGFLDLLTISFLTGYVQRPGHFFGAFGLLSFACGFVIGLYITYLRITTGGVQYRYPLLFLGMLLMIIGIQLISTGLVAELLIHTKSRKSTKSCLQETTSRFSPKIK